MRVTLETKRRTRAGLVEAAERLFRTRGFGEVTTRDVAEAAGVGHGTLFNYFSSREALGLAVCDVLLARAAADAGKAGEGGADTAEALFAHGAACLRRLKPLREHAGALLVALLSLPDDPPPEEGEPRDDTPGQPLAVRRRFLGAVRDVLARRRGGAPADPALLQLYASLFVGVLSSWSRDPSPHQEDTLALLDQATRLFAAALDAPTTGKE